MTPFITSITVVLSSGCVDKKGASEIPNGKNGRLYFIVWCMVLLLAFFCLTLMIFLLIPWSVLRISFAYTDIAPVCEVNL